jgi:tRNA A-37 threonylcarbamoyl transferase component Bud32
MSPRTQDELVNLLGQLRLVDAELLLRCAGELPPGGPAEPLLQMLESRNALTPFQSEKIRKGESDGLVLGGYKLLYRNASGSFARVFRACGVDDNRMIGLKVLRDRWANDSDMVRLFHREGDIGQRLKHPNIVPVYGAFVQGNYHYISMEFVEGGNLRDFVKIRGKLSAEEACRYGLDMSQALEYALHLGVTHRDLKMTNVLMSSHGVSRLIDFGLAADEGLLSRIGSSDLQQAVEYTTLERGSGAPANDPRSDLFFLGVILYELLSGEPPYQRTRDREERKRFSRYRDVRPVTAVESSVPRRVASIVDRLLRISPHERHQSATELSADLRSALADLGHPTGPESNGEAAATVLCVEDRPPQQDLLRQYLTKHGFQVQLVNDVDRAIGRVKQQPPACVLLMAESIGDRAAQDFQKVLTVGRPRFVSAVLVLGTNQTHLKAETANDNPLGKILHQPVTLRDVRSAIRSGLDVRARYVGRGHVVHH